MVAYGTTKTEIENRQQTTIDGFTIEQFDEVTYE